MIIHDYNKNQVLAQQLLNAGCYLSFGKAIQFPELAKVVANIARDRFFLESDDAPDSIESIYKGVADLRNISIEALSLQLQKNTLSVFKIPV